MSFWLDDADLALIEVNAPTRLVQRLTEEVRRLKDQEDELRSTIAWLESRLEELEGK